jgi:hypothetical protein
MKLPISCAQCMQDDVISPQILTTVEFRDDGRYEITCPKGHVSTTILQQQKFEVLFDIGAYAIGDGYYREAVSSFTSALERFYEFFIKVICISKGSSSEETLKTWKEVSNQSERQLGAFIFLYYLEFGEKPVLLRNPSVKLRNEVVHKGKIPSKEQAIIYGQEVLDVIRPIIKILKENHAKPIRMATFRHVSGARTQDDEGRAVLTLGIRTILSLRAGPSHEQRTLEMELNELRKR